MIELKPAEETVGFDADGTEQAIAVICCKLVIWIFFPDELFMYVDGATAAMGPQSTHRQRDVSKRHKIHNGRPLPKALSFNLLKEMLRIRRHRLLL